MQRFAFLHRLIPILGALIISLLVGAILAVTVGESPGVVFRTLLFDTLGDLDSFGYVLFNATPLIFTGLAVAVGFQAGLFNIGCEGQLYVGGLAAAWCALTLSAVPSPLLVLLCILFAMMAGGIWGAIPGWLKARFGAHEVINTIMMNFIAVGLVDYLVLNHLKAPDEFIAQTPEISSGIRFPRLGSLPGFLSPNHPLEISLLVAIGAAILLFLFLRKTVWGYEIRMVGLNPEAAIRSGISHSRTLILSMAISGALAGWVGLWDVLGYHYRFVSGFSSGWGFLGIAVALLARNHPLGVLLAAGFFGLLSKGALDLELFTAVPREVVLIVEALAILLLIVCDQIWRKQRHRMGATDG